MGQKLQKADSFKKKKEKQWNSAKWVITLNVIKSILGATVKIHDRLHTLFGPSSLWDAGQSISIPIPWVCHSLRSESCLLLSRLQTPFFKTWCKQNPMESVLFWPRVHGTAYKLESIQGEILAGNSGNRPGSNTQTWLFPFYAIRYTWLILLNSWTEFGSLWPSVVAFIGYIHAFKCT